MNLSIRYLSKYIYVNNYLVLTKAKGDLPLNQLFDISWVVNHKLIIKKFNKKLRSEPYISLNEIKNKFKDDQE
jgi:hypothetical protein